ncbi:MAG: DHH family phosphoesterase [Nitriliruptoraceae bacterium]
MTVSSSALAPWRGDLDPAAHMAAVAALRDACERGSTVLLAGHVGPDGDTLGSVLALHLALGAAGAHTLPTVGEEPIAVPRELRPLPASDELVEFTHLPPAAEADLLVTLDAASPDRLGRIGDHLAAGVHTLVVDHHARATSFGDIRLIAPRAAATVQLVALLLDDLELPLTSEVATCLYVGLVTDSGRFSYATTDASALELGARLLDAGVDHVGWNRRLFETRSLGEVQLLGRGLQRVAFVADVGLVHTRLTHDEVARTGDGDESSEALVDVVRSVDVAEVAMVLKPGPDGTWRGSLRSAGAVDVGRIAASFGGGGHRAAAGFTTDMEAETVVEQVTELLGEA